jgi:hypothetical protein
VNFNPAESMGGLSRRQFGKLLCLTLPVTALAYAPSGKKGVHSDLEFTSSDMRLVAAFRWAKEEALSYVFDNDPVGPWYEASLPGRQAFCMRDTSHQADGAQALGLARYNHNMLHRFAENISASRDWCSYWEIDRLNRPAPVDYKSDAEFWYNLPANYDILDTCYRMYLWTGDRSYIEDPVFLNFYDRTVNEYTTRWNLGPDRIMARKSDIPTPPFFRGDPTYEESSRDNLVGIDLLATQYAAYRAYAAIQSIRGNKQGAHQSLQTAAQVRSLINTVWWNQPDGYFYAFFNKQHRFTGRAGSDVLYRDAAEDGPRTASALHTLLTGMKTEPKSAVEAKSHYAEILYRYGDPDAASAQIIDLTRQGRERREYPEVSYSVVGAVVTGLMGVRVKPALPLANIVAGKPFEPVTVTLSQLTEKSGWAEICNLSVQNTSICVRHEGNRSTRLINRGKSALRWHPAFEVSSRVLLVDGKPHQAHIEPRSSGHAVTWVELTVEAGSSAHVTAPS